MLRAVFFDSFLMTPNLSIEVADCPLQRVLHPLRRLAFQPIQVLLSSLLERLQVPVEIS
jgi:hypothetical protein